MVLLLLNSSSSRTEMSKSETPHQHFLIAILPGIGQLIPARRLARRILRLRCAHVTIATPLSSHRRLFPTSTTAAGEPEDATQDSPLNLDGSGIISYAPYSDGFDEGFDAKIDSGDRYMSELKSTGLRTLSDLAHALEARGRRVTCILYSIILTWATDIGRDLGVPAVLYWIQPASLFAIYYHYFRDRRQSFSSRFADIPGLPRLRLEDLPTILTSASPFRSGIEEIFSELAGPGKERRVLVNTFSELEAAAMDGVTSTVELIAMGPIAGEELEEEEDCGGYMEWLEEQQKGSVIYVAFGSVTLPAVRQVEEIERGLRESGRPYLWVQRKGSGSRSLAGNGMVVEWCEQGRVLAHRAVGCFVTHCGWNSMSEAILRGVPMVMMPEWMDQITNAALAEMDWGIGVRPEAGEDGVVEAVELRRCIGMVMGEGKKGREIRRRAEEWKEKAAEAIADDGPSTRNLQVFLEGL